MKSVRITVDAETLRQVDRVAKPLGLKRSEIVRQALRQWLRQQPINRFEQDWKAALGRRPDDDARAEAWLKAQEWSRK
jgi:predicted transcriptional regulator